MSIKTIVLSVLAAFLIVIIGGVFLYMKTHDGLPIFTESFPLKDTQTEVRPEFSSSSRFLFPAGGEDFNANLTKPETYQIRWTPVVLKNHEYLEFWIGREGSYAQFLIGSQKPDFSLLKTDITKIDLARGTADWTITYDRSLGGGSLKQQAPGDDSLAKYYLILRKVRQTDCFEDARCDQGGPSFDEVFTLKSNPFHIAGPFY